MRSPASASSATTAHRRVSFRKQNLRAATCMRHALPKKSANTALAAVALSDSGSYVDFIKDVMYDVSEPQLTLDTELEVIHADYPFHLDSPRMKFMHLGPHSIADWRRALVRAHDANPAAFAAEWAQRDYTIVPWRFFTALVSVCEDKLRRPLSYFRIDLPAKAAKEAAARAKLMDGAGFDVNDPDAIPPSDDWVWTTEVHKSGGKGQTQKASRWIRG